MKSLFKRLSLILLLVFILFLSIHYLGADNVIEQYYEKIIKSKVGIDIDFTPYNDHNTNRILYPENI